MKRPMLGLIFTLESLRQQGVDVDTPLREAGIPVMHFRSDAWISRDQELRILQVLAAATAVPLQASRMFPVSPGLMAASAFSLACYGPLSMLLVSCESSWEALQEGIRFQAMTLLFGTLSLEPGVPHSYLRLRPAVVPEAVNDFVMDRDLAAIVKLVRDLQSNLGFFRKPVRMILPERRSSVAKSHAAFFECPVECGGDDCVIVFANEDALFRFPTANVAARHVYRQQCEQLLADSLAESESLAARVSAYLVLFAGAYPSAAQVARVFGWSERSLRRHLSREGQPFRTILDRVREARAAQLLSAGAHSVAAIAEQLGYSETSSFNHAATRWKRRQLKDV